MADIFQHLPRGGPRAHVLTYIDRETIFEYFAAGALGADDAEQIAVVGLAAGISSGLSQPGSAAWMRALYALVSPRLVHAVFPALLRPHLRAPPALPQELYAWSTAQRALFFDIGPRENMTEAQSQWFEALGAELGAPMFVSYSEGALTFDAGVSGVVAILWERFRRWYGGFPVRFMTMRVVDPADLPRAAALLPFESAHMRIGIVSDEIDVMNAVQVAQRFIFFSPRAPLARAMEAERILREVLARTRLKGVHFVATLKLQNAAGRVVEERRFIWTGAIMRQEIVVQL